ncbi:MAG: ribosome biogenesis GTPase Der [Geminicoccaceae bacterium]
MQSSTMSFTVAIVGRPNVGKSTLFNRLLGKKQALVDPTPGVTRDRIEGEARIGDLTFTAIDTAGLAEGKATELEGRLLKQTEAAVKESDLALMLIDAKSGLTALDRQFATWLRKQTTPVVLVANKCEGLAAESASSEAWALGLGPPIPISAQNGEGLAGLADLIREHMAAAADRTADPEFDPAEDDTETDDEPLRLAVVGRPNVGKSSLINRLLKDERLLTGPEPGLTRDAVNISWSWRGRRIDLVDTAGLRRRTRVDDNSIEKLSTKASLQAIRSADVVLLMVDATAPLEKQDLTIANRAIDAGKTLMVTANKWDLVEDRKRALQVIKDRIELRLPQIKGVVCLSISVRTGKNIDRLLPAAVELETTWSKRVSTAMVNRWLEHATDDHAPPLAKGRRIRIRYATQIATRPPTFALFVSQAGALPGSYLRYLANSLRETFDFDGVPLRLLERSGKNPFAKN